jgi:hypothetical protein
MNGQHRHMGWVLTASSLSVVLCPMLSSFVVVRRPFNICRRASMCYSGAVWAVSDEAGVWVVGAYIAHNRVQNLQNNKRIVLVVCRSVGREEGEGRRFSWLGRTPEISTKCLRPVRIKTGQIFENASGISG